MTSSILQLRQIKSVEDLEAEARRGLMKDPRGVVNIFTAFSGVYYDLKLRLENFYDVIGDDPSQNETMDGMYVLHVTRRRD